MLFGLESLMKATIQNTRPVNFEVKLEGRWSSYLRTI